MHIHEQQIRDLLRRTPHTKNRHIAVTGASGSGKTTILKKDPQSVLNVKPEEFDFSISGTCRPPRANEFHGVDYFFFETEEDFRNANFLETNDYGGNKKLYGTLFSEVERITIDEKKSMVLDLDINGGKRMKAIYKQDLLWIFLRVPVDTLYKRLKNRQSETKETDQQIVQRIETAEKELKSIKDKIFVPDLVFDYDNNVTPAEAANFFMFKADYRSKMPVH